MGHQKGLLCLGLSQFFQLKVNVMMARFIHTGFFRLYIFFLGLLFYLFKKEERKNITINQRQALRIRLKSNRVSPTLIKTFFGIFAHYHEKLLMAYKPLPKLKIFLESRLRLRNKHYLDRVLTKGKGAILVTGHFGAVEFLPMALSLQGYKVAMILKYKTKRLKEKLPAKVKPLDIMLIDASEPLAALKALKAIKNGRLLITECDEFKEWLPCDKRKIKVFGATVPLDKSLDFFYHKTKVPALLCLISRNNNSFTLFFEPLVDGQTETSLSERAWTKMERFIIEQPYQWYQWKSLAPILLTIDKPRQINAHKKNQYLPPWRSFYPVYIT